MCLFKTPSMPQVAMPSQKAMPPEPAAAPQASDPNVTLATQKTKQARLKAAGANNTILTGGAGLNAPAQTATKTLYGQ